MKKGTGLLLVVSMLVLILIVIVVKSYSSLSKVNEEVINKESDLNVQLSRKKEQTQTLIINYKRIFTEENEDILKIEKTIETFKTIYEDNIEEKSAKNKELSEELNVLFTNKEKELLDNEELKLNVNEILLTEKRLLNAKNNYNNAVDDYNDKIKSIPSSIIASIRGFKTKEVFSISIELNNIIEKEEE